jgi:dTDP-4-dehydrorhamnose 3,5-epimerase
VPIGCAHGFQVISASADFVYKTTEHWFPENERCIIWNDKDLSINWDLENIPILSQEDAKGNNLKHAEYFK